MIRQTLAILGLHHNLIKKIFYQSSLLSTFVDYYKKQQQQKTFLFPYCSKTLSYIN